MKGVRGVLSAAFLMMTVTVPVLAVTPDQEAYTACVSAATSGKATLDEAVAQCSGPARSGATGAMYALGVLLLKSSRPINRTAGLAWLEKAANGGHALAAFALAKAKIDESSEADKAIGAKWLRFAACNGYAPAQELAKDRGLTSSMSDCPVRTLANFEGTWAGELTELKSSDDARAVQISVGSNTIRVLTKVKDKWIEVKPGKFTKSQIGSSLLLVAMDTGWDLDGQWIESWSFALLRLTPTEVLVSFTRTVNNPNLPADLEWRAFTSVAEGHLTLQER